MEKIESEFIRNQYRSGIESYANYTKEVGLWRSEQYVFQKHLKESDKILDLGCGTGRTTFPLYNLNYKDIVGVDLTPEMIQEAQKLNHYFGTAIEFKVGDARNLDFPDSIFEAVVFSFNGLMSIPRRENRSEAIREIHRVLKAGGIFIFTTHDRDKEAQFLGFWKEEAERWSNESQNPQLYEFGDLITPSKNESRKIFIHIPNQAEIINDLSENGFDLVETFYRIDKFEEDEKVTEKSGECRFWIAKKIG